jgi:CBS domain-containing protein
MIRNAGVSSLVVERHDESDEFGMLTIRDIAREVVAQDKPADRTGVYEIMTKPVLTVPAEMNIKYAVRLLTRYSVSRAVVIDHDRNPVGIVTLRDMVLGYNNI